MPRKPNCKCSVCDKEIYRRPRDFTRSKSGNVYCSSICANKPNEKPHPCPICNKTILSGGNKECCSRSCANKYRKGIKYNKPEDPNTQKVYRRLLVEQRGEVCESCGYSTVPEIIIVHHIIERNQGGDNKLINLKLLCPNCHAIIHYGKSAKLERCVSLEN